MSNVEYYLKGIHTRARMNSEALSDTALEQRSFLKSIRELTRNTNAALFRVVEGTERNGEYLAKMSKVVRVAAQENAVPETQEELNELKAEARKWLDEASVGQDTNKIISPDDLLL